MARGLVTIARFPSLVGADLARSRLQADGIPAFLANEYSAATSGGSVGLQVSSEDVDDALQVLGVEPTAETAATGPPEPEVYCPICRSSSAQPVSPALPLRVLRHALALVVPIPTDWFETRRRRCEVCAHEWRPAE